MRLETVDTLERERERERERESYNLETKKRRDYNKSYSSWNR